ncbi:helix-turn-helix domain-containing protein [Methylosarcina fibrata]|uniref:helix-turn-helix domain-containing protein n=1 Tax=Methylosarcina fibrata TaxID=105972 RepID=UPI00039A4770|nr:helix-turn-helix domain-containing protein [Methylosarcina fibrata]
MSRPHRGRKPSVDTAEIKRLRDEEKLGATEIARRLGIGRATVYRALASGGQET